MQNEQLDFTFSDDDLPPPDLHPAAFIKTTKIPPHLKSVRISGLKSFDDTEVILPKLTLLTGPNNSGKSTVLQAIALGYECLRRCTDANKWRLVESGRAVTGFEFLPVNEPRDLWFQRIWKPTKNKERAVEITLQFEKDISFSFKIRFLFGVLNIKLSNKSGEIDGALLQSLLSSAPVLLPATPGPAAHEEYLTLAAVHQLLSIREPSRVVRNILRRVQEDENQEAVNFINSILKRYFKVELGNINFDEKRDLELRAPINQGKYDLDIVSSGSGLNQILQLACIIAWRKPSLVLLDEPDAHLHSSVQAELFDLLSDLANEHNVQIILSTHSRDLISQAPLESIVPVDRTRSKLQPLQSLDHLLLEYQRYGSLSNVDLALLYQTKSCIFVEGRSDVKFLPRIAERCGFTIFTGSTQIVPFEFQGVSKLKFIPDLAKLFERLIGSSLSWGVIRDLDSTIPSIRQKYEEIGKKLGAKYFHIWNMHSLENYLLKPTLILTAINARFNEKKLSLNDIESFLSTVVNNIEDEESAVFITRAQHAYKEFDLDANPLSAGATAANRYLKQLDNLDKKISAYPGKLIFGKLGELLQKEHGINLRIEDLIAILTTENVPEEILHCLNELKIKLLKT